VGQDQSIQSKGGRARAANLTQDQRADIARRAASARWQALSATHEGELPIGDTVVSCAVLNDGRRVLSQSGFMRALGRARQAKGRAYYKGDVNLPAFLTAQNLKVFIPKDLEVTSSQIEFRTIKGQKAYGYSADLLPAVVSVFLDADRAGVLVATQKHIAERAYILAKALMNVAITALVDEATGYQEVRDKQALQAILDKYLRKEFALWAKRFPDDFYRQIFRLRGWEWKGMKVNRPQVVAAYTKDIVYARLAPGVLDELERRNPPTQKKGRVSKHHQWLTDEIGLPALEQHMHAVLALQRVSKDWDHFKRMLDVALPKRGDTLQLDLFTDGDSRPERVH
jgi:hypothetical protein